MASSTSLLAGLATDETLNAVLQKTTDVITAITGATPTAAQIAAAIKDIQPNDYALQSTLSAILQKQIIAPSTDASVQAISTSLNTGTAHTDAQQIVTGLQSLGTQTTLAAILAKLPSSPATDTPHSTTTAGTAVAGTGLTNGQTATDAQLLNALINLFGSTSGLPHTDSAAITAALGPLATQSTLNSLLTKTSGDQATQTTLAAVLAKLPASPATDTPHSTTTAATAVAGSGLTNGQTASDAQLLNALLNYFGSTSGLIHTDSAAILAKLSADPATQTTLAALNTKTSSDQATQTTLAAVLAKLVTSPALDATVASVVTALGTGANTGVAKIEDAASSAGDRGIAMMTKRGPLTPALDVDTAGDYVTPMADGEGKLVVQVGSVVENTWQGYQLLTTTTAAALKAAAGTGLRNYLKSVFISASQGATGVAHIITIMDGTTVIARQAIPNTVTSQEITFDPPLKGTANTALNVQSSAAPNGTSIAATGWVGV